MNLNDPIALVPFLNHVRVHVKKLVASTYASNMPCSNNVDEVVLLNSFPLQNLLKDVACPFHHKCKYVRKIKPCIVNNTVCSL